MNRETSNKVQILVSHIYDNEYTVKYEETSDLQFLLKKYDLQYIASCLGKEYEYDMTGFAILIKENDVTTGFMVFDDFTKDQFKKQNITHLIKPTIEDIETTDKYPYIKSFKYYPAGRRGKWQLHVDKFKEIKCCENPTNEPRIIHMDELKRRHATGQEPFLRTFRD